MIKIETHSHSAGGSRCGTVTSEQLIEEYLKAGYGGVVLTNHYCRSYYSKYPGQTHKEKIKFYLSLRDDLQEKAKKFNFKVFTGAEIRVVTPLDTYSEFMIYGFDDSLLYDNKPLFELTQKELFELSEKNNLFMYQTHPFRNGVMTGNPKYMHGAEAFNGHFHHLNSNEIATTFCESNNLVKMSGTDYHDYLQPINAGIYIPKEINTNAGLAEFLRKGKFDIIQGKKVYEEGYKKRHNKG